MFRRKSNEYRITEKKKIGVIGIGHGVGTSTIAENLTFTFKEKGIKVSFCDLSDRGNRGGTYYRLFMDKNFMDEVPTDFYKALQEGKPIHRLQNIWEGINWAITLPNSSCSDGLNLDQQQRLINNISGEVVIANIEYNFGDKNLFNKLRILEDFDIIVVVVEPLPSKIMENFDMVRKIKEMCLLGYEVVWVVNKYNKGVHRKDLMKSLRIDDFRTIPLLSAEKIYDCEYRCKKMVLDEKNQIYVDEIIDEIMKKIEIFTK